MSNGGQLVNWVNGDWWFTDGRRRMTNKTWEGDHQRLAVK